MAKLKIMNDYSGIMFRESANRDLCLDKEKYQMYCELARQLNLGDSPLLQDDFIFDCFHQPYRGCKEFNHVDAYYLTQLHDRLASGEIQFCILEAKDFAKRDKDINKNTEILENLLPFRGNVGSIQADVFGDKKVGDGYLNVEGELVFMLNTNDGEQSDFIKVSNFDGILEIGYTDVATTYAHLIANCGSLARFPYKRKMVGLFINQNFEENYRRAFQ